MLVTALLIGWFLKRQEVREDTAIGIVFTGMFVLGILLMSTVRSFRDFSHILFGNVLGVTPQDLRFIAGVAVVVLLLLALCHKELELTSVDPGSALAIGLPVDGLRYLLLALLDLTLVSAIQAVGVVLTSALLITPAATASLLTHRQRPMMAVAALIAIDSSVAGLYASSGAAIVLICMLTFVVARHGLKARWEKGTALRFTCRCKEMCSRMH